MAVSNEKCFFMSQMSCITCPYENMLFKYLSILHERKRLSINILWTVGPPLASLFRLHLKSSSYEIYEKLDLC